MHHPEPAEITACVFPFRSLIQSLIKNLGDCKFPVDNPTGEG
jgi:hypothetical protein